VDQRELLSESNWKYLIVLDACRFDYFAELVGDYLEGKLFKVLSPGSYTLEWARKVWNGYHEDIVYVSANPFISGELAELQDLSKLFACKSRSFDASQHFYDVIDVWYYGWSDSLGTVLPEEVEQSACWVAENFPEKRLVIHYIQPHEPFLAVDVGEASRHFRRALLNLLFETKRCIFASP